jgi:hypothetical protein
MSFKATFTAGGKTYNVLDASYAMKQETDQTGRPSSVTRGGKITVTVEANNETDLHEWMMNSWERKDGKLTWIKRDSNATSKELNYNEAYMVDFKEGFNHADQTPATITFTISAKKLTIGNGSYENEWPIN